MDSTVVAEAPVRYLLTSRLSPEGQVSIMLKLYRGHHVALTKSVAVIDLDQTAEVMRKCRQHLGDLGLQPLSSDSLRSRSMFAPSAGLPQASRLFQPRRRPTDA